MKKKKFYLWILGCQMNYSDAERIITVFNNAGLSQTDQERDADYIITIACSVRQTAIDRIFGKIKDWNKLKGQKKVSLILTGCVLEKDRQKLSKIFDLVFNIQDTAKLQEYLGEKKDSEKTPFFSLTPKYQSKFRAYVPISFGCNNFCSYCAVPYTRGPEKSRSEKEVIEEVKKLIDSRYKEITLLGQNVNSYGNDLGKKDSFTRLISKIDKIPGNYRVYFYSNHPKDISNNLINVLPKLKHFPPYLHLPLQSGSDKIISAMNRHYTQTQYLNLVKKIKKKVPNITLTTDIIVGFPGETDEDFRETKKLMELIGFSMAFIAQYSPRPQTISAKVSDNVPKTEKEKRFQMLTKVLAKNLEKENARLVNKKMEVLIDEVKKENLYGRTGSYKVVEIPDNQQANFLGQFVEIEITGSNAWKLSGKIL
ncbi:MAG: tRNA (N6-isopentenyl adenosine(37)-C2)-methylthiotransferase MiaB [Bacteriovoracaceae bacterium]